jgi:hypothetical protein
VVIKFKALAARLASGDQTVTVEELTSFVQYIGKTVGTISEEDEGATAADALDATFVRAVLAVMGLSDDDRLEGVLSAQWGMQLAMSRISTFTHEGDKPLPSDLGSRSVEVARRKEERERLVAKKWIEVQSLIGPIMERAGEIAHAKAEASKADRPQSGYPAPEPQRYGVSARGAELWVADALRWLGATDVEVTQQSGDGGVDVLTSDYAVCVKHYAGTIPVEEVREIFGVSTVMRRTPMLWTSGSLTLAGAEFAEVGPVPAFHYDVETATILALNQHAQDLLDRGI